MQGVPTSPQLSPRSAPVSIVGRLSSPSPRRKLGLQVCPCERHHSNSSWPHPVEKQLGARTLRMGRRCPEPKHQRCFGGHAVRDTLVSTAARVAGEGRTHPAAQATKTLPRQTAGSCFGLLAGKWRPVARGKIGLQDLPMQVHTISRGTALVMD